MTRSTSATSEPPAERSRLDVYRDGIRRHLETLVGPDLEALAESASEAINNDTPKETPEDLEEAIAAGWSAVRDYDLAPQDDADDDAIPDFGSALLREPADDLGLDVDLEDVTEADVRRTVGALRDVRDRGYLETLLDDLGRDVFLDRMAEIASEGHASICRAIYERDQRPNLPIVPSDHPVLSRYPGHRIRRFSTRTLARDLSDAEVLDRSAAMARVHAEIAAHEARVRTQRAADKEESERLEAERERLIGVVRDRKETEVVPVVETVDLDAGLAYVIRQDTGEIVLRRPLSTEERQATFDL